MKGGNTSPLTFAGIAGGLMAVAILAAYFHGRRATDLDPMVTLHGE